MYQTYIFLLPEVSNAAVKVSESGSKGIMQFEPRKTGNFPDLDFLKSKIKFCFSPSTNNIFYMPNPLGPIPPMP